MFEQNTTGFDVLGSVVCLVVGVLLIWTMCWWKCQGGRDATIARLEVREKRVDAVRNLPSELEFLKARIEALTEHTGLVVDDEKDIEMDVEKDAETDAEKDVEGEGEPDEIVKA